MGEAAGVGVALALVPGEEAPDEVVAVGPGVAVPFRLFSADWAAPGGEVGVGEADEEALIRVSDSGKPVLQLASSPTTMSDNTAVR